MPSQLEIWRVIWALCRGCRISAYPDNCQVITSLRKNQNGHLGERTKRMSICLLFRHWGIIFPTVLPLEQCSSSAHSGCMNASLPTFEQCELSCDNMSRNKNRSREPRSVLSLIPLLPLLTRLKIGIEKGAVAPLYNSWKKQGCFFYDTFSRKVSKWMYYKSQFYWETWLYKKPILLAISVVLFTFTVLCTKVVYLYHCFV